LAFGLDRDQDHQTQKRLKTVSKQDTVSRHTLPLLPSNVYLAPKVAPNFVTSTNTTAHNITFRAIEQCCF